MTVNRRGTAGVPMLDCIEKEGLVDVAVVVTRYFGGIKLGTGGLVRHIRAWSNWASKPCPHANI